MIYKRILKHGNCLAITIPAAWFRLLELQRGDFVAIGLAENNLIVIKKANASMAEFLKSKPIQTND